MIIRGFLAFLWLITSIPVLATEEVQRVVYLDQGWNSDLRKPYYHLSQGTLSFPMSWLLALEQPGSDRPFLDLDYLANMGFLTDGIKTDEHNPYGLPVGFAFARDPDTDVERFGFTCASCHTNQLNYQGTGIVIDGGGSLQNISLFEKQITQAFRETTGWFQWRNAKFDRFAHKVLGDTYSPETKNQLYQDVSSVSWLLTGFHTLMWFHRLEPTDEGYGRLDALQRIANTLLGDYLDETPGLFGRSNYQPIDAPVDYPHLWDIWMFDFVQYNGSVHQPMARNIGEALGSRAKTNFIDDQGHTVPEPERWNSSAPVTNLKLMEEWLWQLEPPAWPEQILGKLDWDKVAAGEQLFTKYCADCHAVMHLAGSDHFVRGKDWDNDNPPVWHVPIIALDKIGTDPIAAVNFARRRYDASKLGMTEPIDTKTALEIVTTNISQRAYDQLGLDQNERKAYDGFGRPNIVRTTCGYKARPLHGIWATPPFLHNGSVPTLYALLSPLDDRPKGFWTGTREFDPVHVGYELKQMKGSLWFDTRHRGNSNAGHLFDKGAGPGIIGPRLDQEQRFALIEYLKAIPNDAVRYPYQEVSSLDPAPCENSNQAWWKR